MRAPATFTSCRRHVRAGEVVADEQQRRVARGCEGVREAIAVVEPRGVSPLAEARPGVQGGVCLIAVDGNDLDPRLA